MDVEKSLLSKAISDKNLLPILDAGIKSSFFLDGEHLAVFNWCLEFWNDYNESPGIEALRAIFPEYRLTPTEEPYDFYVDQMMARRQWEMVVDTLEQVREPMEDEDSATALKIMASQIELIHSETLRVVDDDLTEDSIDRIAYYEGMKMNGPLRGIPTGFPTMDLATGGLLPEQLVTITGLPKSSKSLTLMLMAIAAHEAANRVLMVTFEQSNMEQRWRHDSWRAHVDYNKMLAGKLNPEEKLRLHKMLRMMDGMPMFKMIHDLAATTTVSGLASKIVQYKPDVVYVDGVYLMDCEVPGVEAGSAQALTSITRSMKRLAQRMEIPVVQTTQSLLSKYSARQGLTMGTVGYTGSFAQDSDVLFGIDTIPDLPNERLLTILASRNTGKRQARLVYDWETGIASEMDEGYDEGDSFGTDAED